MPDPSPSRPAAVGRSGISAVIEQYGKAEDVELSTGGEQFPDYLGVCTGCLRPMDYVRSTFVIANLVGSAAVAWILRDYFHGYGYHDFDVSARWISGSVGGFVFLIIVHTCCSGKGLRGPFERSTCELIVSNPHHALSSDLYVWYPGLVSLPHTCGVSSSGSCKEAFNWIWDSLCCNWLGTYRNRLRVPLLAVHLLACGAVFTLWQMLSKHGDAKITVSVYYRLIESADRIRTAVYIVIIIAPTLTGLIDFAQVRRIDALSATGSPSRPGRLYWSTLSLILKAAIYGCIVLVVDPPGTHFFKKQAATGTEKIVLWIVTGVLGYLVISFWATYHNCHAGEREKPFAYTDFPATICLVMSYVYLLHERLQDVDTVRVPHDYMLMMAYVATQAVGILNIPPELDFSDILRKDATVYRQQTQREPEQEEMAIVPVSPFVIED